MKVFISWSGAMSRCVALALRDWLPNAIQSIDPYVSSEDIDKGARWSSDISTELENADFGVLCVTAENLHAPWVNFEAGALSKSLERARVSPFLYGLDRTQVTGPLLQFQSTINEKADVLKLVKSMNRTCGEQALEEARLESIFDVWWPKLEQGLGACHALDPSVDEPARSEDDLLAEVLELVREQQRILSNPTALLPPEYLQYAVSRSRPPRIPSALVRDLTDVQHWLMLVLKEKEAFAIPEDLAASGEGLRRELEHAIAFLERQLLDDPARRRPLRPTVSRAIEDVPEIGS